MSSLIVRATQFAIDAHGPQKRKYTNEPYFNHCLRVAQIVEEQGHPEETVAAALLHDTLEDTKTTAVDLKRAFGLQVAYLVLSVTDVSKWPEDGSREQRKRIDREHLEQAPPEGKAIKLADMIDNTDDITRHDPGFAKVYLKEKRLLLPLIRQGGWALSQRALAQLEECEEKL